ncbi:MAG: hypothetical protein J6V76_04000 [Bacteroidales bacterium]|nr:hypothetical protein [Bacteroidales bacterium]
MKKLLYVAALCAAVSFYACNDGVEQMLVGRWTLEKSEIADLDSFCEYQSRKSLDEIDKELKQIDMELETADKVVYESLVEHRRTVEKRKEMFAPDSIKIDVENNMKELIGNFFFDVRGNKTFSLSSPNDSVSGNWSLLNDSVISTLISGRPSEDVLIMSISGSKLVLSSTEYDDDGYELTTIMSYSK